MTIAQVKATRNKRKYDKRWKGREHSAAKLNAKALRRQRMAERAARERRSFGYIKK